MIKEILSKHEASMNKAIEALRRESACGACDTESAR